MKIYARPDRYGSIELRKLYQEVSNPGQDYIERLLSYGFRSIRRVASRFLSCISPRIRTVVERLSYKTYNTYLRCSFLGPSVTAWIRKITRVTIPSTQKIINPSNMAESFYTT